MLEVRNTETRHTAMPIHIHYYSYIEEYDNDGIERQFYNYLDNKRYDVTHYSTETINTTPSETNT